MSAERRSAAMPVAVLCGLVACGTAAADSDELPPLELLEYLGSWEESDEVWILIEELDEKPVTAKEQGQSDVAPQGDTSTEFEHES